MEQTTTITFTQEEKDLVNRALSSYGETLRNKELITPLIEKVSEAPEDVDVYSVKIEYDHDAENSRDGDNFGKMVCWHRRYSLGDEHNFDDPADFKRDLINETAEPQSLIKYVLDNSADDLRFLKDAVHTDGWWKLQSKYDGKWYDEYEGDSGIPLNDRELAEKIVEEMSHKDLDKFMQEKAIILPLHFYDHSVISISADSFLGRAQHAEWDSGQVGYVYATHADVEKEFGEVTPETLKKAELLMKGEVETYDYYLRGECYGYSIEKNGEDLDSCWGFVGDFNEVKKDMVSQAGKEYAPLFEKIDQCGEYEFSDKELTAEDEDELEL